MIEKKVLKKVALKSLLFYVSAMSLISALLFFVKEFVQFNFGLGVEHSFFGWWFFSFLTSLYFVLFFNIIPFLIIFFPDNIYYFGFGMIFWSIVSNILLYLVIFVFTYYFEFKNKSEKNEVLIKATKFLKWLLIGLIVILFIFSKSLIPYILHKNPTDEDKTCRLSRIIKQRRFGAFPIIITEKGVCARCNDFKRSGLCKNVGESFVAEGLNNGNFDFEVMSEQVSEDYRFIKINFEDKVFYVAEIEKSDYSGFDLLVDDVDPETFQYLGGKYSKDKNGVYYKNKLILADPETFVYEKGDGKKIGKGRDKNGTWVKGVLQEN